MNKSIFFIKSSSILNYFAVQLKLFKNLPCAHWRRLVDVLGVASLGGKQMHPPPISSTKEGTRIIPCIYIDNIV